MARLSPLLFSIFFAICVNKLSTSADVSGEERKVYIVYMGSLPKDKYSPTEHHTSMLHEVVNSSKPEELLVTSYTRSFNGFAAYLTEEEQQKMASHKAVVWVIPSKTLELQTTKSWDFMGFPQDVRRNPNTEGDMIIGVIDSGIWPESLSFSDTGFRPIPSKWKGVCRGGPNFRCNKKIIGARYYSLARSPRDYMGHGTHTASVAAGNYIKDASFYGIAQGLARGGVPLARIAIYNVCSQNLLCSETDVLHAFDDAIADGVDIINVSLGPKSARALEDDPLSLGSFHAAMNDILTITAAGNYGFKAATVSTIAPWLFTVAASSINRKIISNVLIGNQKIITGRAVNGFNTNPKKLPIVYGKNASRVCNEVMARLCSDRCLDRNLVRGKFVLCGSFEGITEATIADAAGSISLSPQAYDDSLVVPCPATSLNRGQFKLVESYLNSTRYPVATIYKSEAVPDSTAPIVATFSSRGPNVVLPDVLKPDIVAPGIDILGAFSPEASPSQLPGIDRRRVTYSLMSGTSMASPHVAGAAAYIKSMRPNWSHSAIKSALMTTSRELTPRNTPYGDAEFSYGAGHINPLKALDPGLVYETPKEDYIKMTCGFNYDDSTLSKIFGENITCAGLSSTEPRNINYPTMAAYVGSQARFQIQFKRTVTNVGPPNSTYKARIKKTLPINISVMPGFLTFRGANQKISFVVTVAGERVQKMISASLEWYDGIHVVRTPIVVYSYKN